MAVVDSLIPWHVTVVVMVFAFFFMLTHYWQRSPLCGFIAAFLFFLAAWMLPATDFSDGAGVIYPATTMVELPFISMAIITGSTGMVMLVTEAS